MEGYPGQHSPSQDYPIIEFTVWRISIDEIVNLQGIPQVTNRESPHPDKLFPGAMRFPPPKPAAIKFMIRVVLNFYIMLWSPGLLLGRSG